VTPDLVGLQWNTVVLYPAGFYASRIAVAASVTMPEGWEFAGALDVDARQGGAVRFKPTTLEMLVDSPLFAGRYVKRLDLDPGARNPVHLDLFADSAELLEVRPQQLAAHRKLVQETYALLGPPHYDRYEFLLALSDHFGDIGLEHHRSSENRRPPGYFIEWDKVGAGRDLLPHEIESFVERQVPAARGARHARFQRAYAQLVVMGVRGADQLLRRGARHEVGTVERGVRARELGESRRQHGLQQGRPRMARPAGHHRAAHHHRAPALVLALVAANGGLLHEGELLWLDIDTRIRELTHDRRSVDDFAHAFFAALPAGAARAAARCSGR